MTQFLVELFEAPDPLRARGEEVTVRQVLDRGAERVADDLAGEPRVRARLLNTLGTTDSELGTTTDGTRRRSGGGDESPGESAELTG